MKPFFLLASVVLVLFFVGEVHSSFYKGGIITYKPNPNSPYSVDFKIRLSIHRGILNCDLIKAANGRDISGPIHWTVTRYKNGSSTGGALYVYCIDSNIQEDQNEVQGNFTFLGDYGDDWWNVSMSHPTVYWMDGITHSSPYTNMLLKARVNRTVSGAFNNSSPVSNLPLTVYIVQGIPSVLKIPVQDPDGDTVRCRIASPQEYGTGMGTYFPHGVLDEGNCTLIYDGNGTAGQLFPILLKLEDFPSGTTQFDSSNSLGSVDMQLVVHIKNPPECNNYTVLNTSDRAASYKGITTKCDYDITKGWYRFMGDAGTTIATSCVDSFHCGSHISIWMQSSHPTQAEGVVNRTVCHSWRGRCCYANDNIRVRNCGRFFVYELVKPTAVCNNRYCGSGNSTNACASSPCRNNGECATTYDGYRCYCPHGYSGKQCEINLDMNPCNSNPCRNGGTCQNGAGWYRCSCPYGYTGNECQFYAIRIQGGGSSGLLQVFYNGEWGTVCDDSPPYDDPWLMNNAHVVCRQLGFGGALSYTNSDRGTGKIWLDDIHCFGNESAIQQCTHRGWGVHNCGHREDVFVTCYPHVCNNYTVLNTSDRAASYKGITTKCDRYDITKGWYRFMGDAGTTIATSCVDSSHCGTENPVWMQGSHPTQTEGIVTRRVCLSQSNRCCYAYDNIRVRNCGEFYIYELIKPIAECNNRYCGSGYSTNTCASSPCRNNGECATTYDGYRCYCPYGYSGKQCEINLKTRVTCEENFMQIDLMDEYFPGLDWRNLHLKNTTCRATKTSYTMRLRAPLDGCGVTYVEHDKKITFWNEVRDEHSLGPGLDGNPSARKRENLVIPFYCEYGREKIVSTSFSPSRKTVHASEGSFGNFTFTMDLYQASNYATPFAPSAYPVVVSPNQPLWVQYEVKNTNADLVVFAENCRATTSTNPDSLPQHVFLEKGCIIDPTMTYTYNPYSNVQRFSIKSFRFVYSNTFLVYLHCELHVCHRNSTNSRCTQECITEPRTRREVADGSKSYELFAGPLKGSNTKTRTDNQGEDETSVVMTATISAASAMAVIALLVVIIMLGRRKRVPREEETPPPAVPMSQTVNSYEQHVTEDGEKTEIEIE